MPSCWVWFGVSEAEPCALGFAWSVLTSPHNIEASRVGAIPFPRSLPPSFSIPVKKGGGVPAFDFCLFVLPNSHPLCLDAQNPVASTVH